MDDIKIPPEGGEEEETFTIEQIPAERTGRKKDEPEEEEVTPKPPRITDKVRISFQKFVELVANHSFVGILEKNRDEEVVVSSSLLADLANAHEKQEERKLPLMFILGLAAGIVVAYVMFKVWG